MRYLPFAVLLTFSVCPAALAAQERPMHNVLEIALAPDGRHLAAVEGDATPSGAVDIRALVIHATADGATATVNLPCGAVHECTPSSPVWAPDGRLAFILRTPGSHAHAVYTVGPEGGTPRRLLAFNGTLVGLRYGPGGRLAVLATEGAAKEVGAVEAGAPVAGQLGADVHEQRIAVVGGDGSLTWASPENLFVYEYDFLPDGSGFVATAAAGDGDNNWWVAKLYAFDAKNGAGSVIYAPDSPQQQLAMPRMAPDGNSVSFIGGIMSDFGVTGGDAFVLPLDRPGARPVNLTAGKPVTVTALAWDCGGKSLLASELAGDQRRIVRLDRDAGGKAETLSSGAESLTATDEPVSLACGGGQAAVVHQDFTHAPEIEFGRIGAMRDLTHANAGFTARLTAQNVTWSNEGYSVQGWLLLPDGADGGARPMITVVHGGPAWANQPWYAGEGLNSRLLHAGYAIFLPNPRGSFGQGEAFAAANVRDLGYGDLRDILAGVTAAEQVAPIDDHRLGIAGWSYGGFMTMWTVTQTNRFRAAVAGAGISNWQSYYGQNGINKWMNPYFGATVYDDPYIYNRSSPINYIRQVKTPTLSVVGERDIECPAPQTEEFFRALDTLGVPSAAVIYPGEGHAFRDPHNLQDMEDRLIAWFAKYL